MASIETYQLELMSPHQTGLIKLDYWSGSFIGTVLSARRNGLVVGWLQAANAEFCGT